jgi:hypothetical protein
MRLQSLCTLGMAVAALAMPLAGGAQPAPTQPAPPPQNPAASAPQMPTLTPDQSEQVHQQMAGERRTMEARVARGEVTPDEAERFLAWREWQIARQVAGLAPPPSPAIERGLETPRPRQYAYAYPPPYYYPPPPPPYYWGPRYYYWGPTVCAGGWGHHGGGRICF